MSFLDLLNHLLNFVAPALALALGLALPARLFFNAGAGAPPWWVQAGWLFLAGVAVLALGLVLTGRDGRMATYAALVLVCGCLQWALLRGWRR